jgi:hypothetical protein
MAAIVNDPLPPPPSSKHPYFKVLVPIGLLILALGFAALLIYVGMMGGLEPE